MLLLFSTRLLRKNSQRLIFVESKVGVGEVFLNESHAPSSGGGGSLGYSEFGAMPVRLLLKVDFSITSWPLEFEPE